MEIRIKYAERWTIKVFGLFFFKSLEFSNSIDSFSGPIAEEERRRTGNRETGGGRVQRKLKNNNNHHHNRRRRRRTEAETITRLIETWFRTVHRYLIVRQPPCTASTVELARGATINRNPSNDTVEVGMGEEVARGPDGGGRGVARRKNLVESVARSRLLAMKLQRSRGFGLCWCAAYRYVDRHVE